ncbi:MAG: acetolactate synthase small subunit [Lentisphaerae bacterium]|jgi:acetolactate synthase-1/3 small subunit|nr:acetolactate synthase small subunit [Lentisphaerota bacterium]
MKHIISAIVENQPGVLARIVGLISGRGYNIHSLNVAPTQDLATSHLTMVVPGDARVLEQVLKQLNKLIDVIKVVDLTEENFLDRELILVKAACTDKNRAALIDLATLFHAEIVRVQNKSLTLQMVGNTEKTVNFLELLRSHGILDIARTGVIAVAKSQE